MKSIYTSKSNLSPNRNQKSAYPIYGLYKTFAFCFGANHLVNSGAKENSVSQVDLTPTLIKNLLLVNIGLSSQKMVNRYSNISNNTFSTKIKNQY